VNFVQSIGYWEGHGFSRAATKLQFCRL
jgi:hypothetical protein